MEFVSVPFFKGRCGLKFNFIRACLLQQPYVLQNSKYLTENGEKKYSQNTLSL